MTTQLPATTALPARLALLCLALCTLLPALAISSANLLLPALAHDFSVSFMQAQWALLAYLLSMTCLLLAAGKLGDVFGRARILRLALLLFVLAGLACSLAPAWWCLLLARAVQGAAAAILLAMALALAADVSEAEQLTRILGLLGSLSALGTAAGPVLGGLSLAAGSWRILFACQALLALLAWLMARSAPALASQAQTRSHSAEFDWPGAMLLSAALLAYALAVSGQLQWLSGLGLTLLSGAAFIWRQGKAAQPLLDLRLLRQPGLRASLTQSLLVSCVMMASLALGPFYLSRVLGLHALALGAALAVGPGVAALCAAPAGRLLQHVPPATAQRVLCVTLGVMVLACLLLAWGVAQHAGLLAWLAPLAMLTGGYSVFQTVNNSAVMRQAPAAQRGLYSGLLNLARNTGLISGAALMSAVCTWLSGAPDPLRAAPQALAQGVAGSLALAALLLLAALATTLLSARVILPRRN